MVGQKGSTLHEDRVMLAQKQVALVVELRMRHVHQRHQCYSDGGVLDAAVRGGN